jgi:hypothetical protein
VQVEVRGPAVPLELAVVLQGVTELHVHVDEAYGAWTCVEQPATGDRRLRCRLPAEASPRTFAIDVRPGADGARIRLDLRPAGAQDPAAADNSATIVLPAT